MSDLLPVAVDAMGGDHAPEAIVSGALAAAKDGVPVVLVGDEARIGPLIPRRAGVAVVHAAHAVSMDSSPAGVRSLPESSIRVALREVGEGRASAVVSCGNSGAVLVAAVIEAGVLEGVDRPAIALTLPRADGGRVVLLDAGANVDCRPEQLASFAQLGSAYASSLGVDAPRVALLSNGEEQGKGNDLVRSAWPLIEALPLHFVGNVEPTQAFGGACDVLVCDGFSGNIMLKAVEGAADTVLSLLGAELRRHPVAKLGAWLLQPSLKRLTGRVAWDAHGGGILLGLEQIVVVGHGRANPTSVSAAIQLAHRAAGQGLVRQVRQALPARS